MRRENEKGRANPMAMSAEERQQMLLTQPVEKIIPKMALPTICSMLITSIYNMADTYFVSQIGTAEATASGTSASAAVGIVFSVMAMIQALAFMFGMGSGTNVSHLLGMGKRKEAEVYSAVGFFSAVAAGVLIAVLGNVFNEPLMRLLGATETAMPYALDYARYIFLAAPFMMGSLSMNNLLRFQGLATYGMVGIISGGLLNMLLDPLLIFVFNMGIAGASIATAISQLTSFVILLVMCSTHADAITIHPRNYRPTKQMYAKILNNGLPSLGRQGIMSVSTSLLNNAAAVYGDPAIAAFATKGAINSFTKALAKELAPSSIQVNAISCGIIDTKMNAHLTKEDINALCDEIPCGRIGTPYDVAKAVFSLIKTSDYLTGQIITLDGGWTV